MRRLIVAFVVVATACSHGYVARSLGEISGEDPSQPTFVAQLGHTGTVNAVDRTRDGRLILTGGIDGVLKVWDAKTGVIRSSFRAADGRGIEDAVFSPDGTLVASAGGADAGGMDVDDPVIRLWDLRTGKLRATLEGHERSVRSLAFSADGQRLATTGSDGMVKLWDVASGKELESYGPHRVPGFLHWLKGDTNSGLAVEFTPSNQVVAAFMDGFVAVLDGSTLDETSELQVPGLEDTALRAKLSRDGKLLAFSFLSGPVVVFDLTREGERLPVLQASGEVFNHGFGLTEDSQVIAVTGGKTTELFDPRTGQKIRSFEPRAEAVQFGRDGTLVCAESTSVHVYSGDAQVAEFRKPTLGARSVVFSPDGTHLFTNTGVWDLRIGSLRAPDNGEGLGDDLAVSPDGKTLAAFRQGYWERSKSQVVLFDAATLTRLTSFESDGKPTYFPDGKSILVGDSRYDASTGALIRSFAHIPSEVEDSLSGGVYLLSPTADVLYYGHEKLGSIGNVAAFGVEDGALIRKFDDPDHPVVSMAVSPDGRRLVAGTYEGQVVVFDTATGSKVKVFTDHTDFVYGVAFSPDGRRLVTSDSTGTLIVRDAQTLDTIRTIHDPGTRSLSLAFSPDGKFVATTFPLVRVHRIEDGASLALESFMLESGAVGLAHDEHGLFTGNDQAFGRVFFRLGADVGASEMMSADQLFEQFHRPSLVAQFFGGQAIEAPMAVSQLGKAPGIELIDPLPATAVAGSKLRVKVHAIDRGSGIGEIGVYVNGARVGEGGERGIRAKASPDRLEVDVVLSPGPNLIEAEAYSIKDRLKSARVGGTVQVTATAEDVMPVLHLVSIALDEYADPAQPLSYAKADGAAVVTALSQQKSRIYRDVIVTRLEDKSATREAFEAALAEVTARASPSDVLVIYAAGHGLMVQCPGDDEPRYHLLTYRSSLRSDATICQHGVSDQRLAELVRAVPARKKLIILDTCQAGGAATEKTLLAMRGAVEIDAIKRLARAEGVAIVAAAKAAEYAGEVPALKHGIFTYALLEGLAGKGSPVGQPTTVFSLLGWLQSEVPTLSEVHFGRPQYPITSLQGQDFPLGIL